MSKKIDVHLLPEHCTAEQLRGGTAIVVDVLRASTTILTALQNGAAGVIPCLSVEAAKAHRAADASVLLGGERSGVIIDGFDLSNSPTDYSRTAVENRTISYTTTNGTRALLRCREARVVLIGAFSNAGRLADYLTTCSQRLHIVCAGTDSEITGEDALFAGCLIDRILSSDCQQSQAILSDTASLVLGWWRFESSERPLVASLMNTLGGKNLVDLSYTDDIKIAAEVDGRPVLAEFEATTGLITVSNADGI